jgi:tetratricopeptide (TPR) repeat protein
VRAVSDGEHLAGSFQIGTARSAVMPPWLAGDLISAVGAGAARAAIGSARSDDKRSAAPAYYDAFEGEAALLGGDDASAERLLKSANEGLPAAELLLRARVFALLGQLYLERDQYGEALGQLERAMQIDPGVLRRLRLALPVKVRASDDVVSEAFVAGLERSPRFDVAERGFLITLRADRANSEACLIGPSGAQLACARAQAKSNEGADVLAGKLLSAFHERVFAPPVDLSQVDANSLDGSTLRGNGQDLSPLLQGGGLE